jgi:hypothetical protein
MASLEAELAYRNARLRAWRVYGVPLDGAWALKASGERPWADGPFTIAGVECIWLYLYCDFCGQVPSGCGQLVTPDWLAEQPDGTLARLEKGLTNNAVARGCTHLTPLLSEDPPEVLELTKLELLAGDPPG